MSFWTKVLEGLKSHADYAKIKQEVDALKKAAKAGHLDEVSMTSDKLVSLLRAEAGVDWNQALRDSVRSSVQGLVAKEILTLAGPSTVGVILGSRLLGLVEDGLKNLFERFQEVKPEKFMDADSVDFVKELAAKAHAVNEYHDSLCKSNAATLEAFYSNARSQIVQICCDVLTNKTLTVDEKRQLFDYLRQKRLLTPYQRNHMRMILQMGRGCFQSAIARNPQVLLAAKVEDWCASLFETFGAAWVQGFAGTFSGHWDLTFPRKATRVNDVKESFSLVDLLSKNPALLKSFKAII